MDAKASEGSLFLFAVLVGARSSVTRKGCEQNKNYAWRHVRTSVTTISRGGVPGHQLDRDRLNLVSSVDAQKHVPERSNAKQFL